VKPVSHRLRLCSKALKVLLDLLDWLCTVGWISLSGWHRAAIISGLLYSHLLVGLRLLCSHFRTTLPSCYHRTTFMIYFFHLQISHFHHWNFFHCCFSMKTAESRKIILGSCIVDFDDVHVWARVFSLRFNIYKVMTVFFKNSFLLQRLWGIISNENVKFGGEKNASYYFQYSTLRWRPNLIIGLLYYVILYPHLVAANVAGILYPHLIIRLLSLLYSLI
jgi:hypothetical protein